MEGEGGVGEGVGMGVVVTTPEEGQGVEEVEIPGSAVPF